MRFLRPRLARPLFVVGAPRSGTSFLGRCIGALPSISYHREPIATKHAAGRVYDGSWNEHAARLFYRSTYRWLLRQNGHGGRRFAEKTPRNCFLIPFLRRSFAGAQFVHIIRDGRDAALSHSCKPWLQAASAGSGEAGSYRDGPYPRFWVEPGRAQEFRTTTDLHRCIWAWRRHVNASLDGLAELPESAVHTLRYEHLVDSPTEEADRLLDFLAVADAGAREKLRRTARQARSTSVGNWRGALSKQQRAQIRREAGPLLHRLGYDDN